MIITAILLSNCGMAPSKDKREWLTLSCSGFAHWDQCYQKASNYRPNGYDMANREENLITQGRTMQVSCK